MTNPKLTQDNKDFILVAISEGNNTHEAIVKAVEGSYHSKSDDISGGVGRTLNAMVKSGIIVNQNGEYYINDKDNQSVDRLPAVKQPINRIVDEPTVWTRVTPKDTGIYPVPTAVRDTLGGTLMGVTIDIWDSSNVEIDQVWLIQNGNRLNVNVKSGVRVSIQIGLSLEATIKADNVIEIVLVMTNKEQYRYQLNRRQPVSVILN